MKDPTKPGHHRMRNPNGTPKRQRQIFDFAGEERRGPRLQGFRV